MNHAEGSADALSAAFRRYAPLALVLNFINIIYFYFSFIYFSEKRNVTVNSGVVVIVNGRI